MSEPTLKLPRGADELLRAFPSSEPDFEAQATAIQARLQASSTDAGVALDRLLMAPDLSAEVGEPTLPPTVRATPAAKSNFAEMARRSLQKQDNSAAELAKELMAATSQSRRPTAEMVERVRAAGKAAAIATPLPNSGRAEDSERNSGVVARAAPVRAASPAPAQGQRGTMIGIAGVAVAVAACVALFLKSGEQQSPTSAALAAEKASDAPSVAVRAPAATPPHEGKPSEGVVTPEALAAAPSPERVIKGGAPAKPAAQSASGTASASGARAAAANVPTKPEAVVLEDDPEPTPTQPAPVAEQRAEPAPEPDLKPAAGNSGSVPLTPSGGAVSTALGSVRGGAQACLAGQSQAVNAVVTFAADGHVLRVSAGGPSGACIQAALSKARIQPFARDSYSAPIVVRPP